MAVKTLSIPWSATEAGSRLAIITFVAAQFIEINMFDIGSVTISAQKLFSLALLPLAILLMGKIYIQRQLVVLAGLISIAYSARYLSELNLDSNFISGNAVVLIGFLGAIGVYSALRTSNNGLSFLAKVWVFFSVFTAILTALQAIKILPLFTVPTEFLQARQATASLQRGVGLKFGPNFQALMLLIGLVFNRIYTSRNRLINALIIVAGIIGTLSRMGMVIAAFIIGYSYMFPASGKQKSLTTLAWRISLIGLVGIIFVAGFYFVDPGSAREFITDRFINAFISVQEFIQNNGVYPPGIHLSSAQERLVLARSAIILGVQNWTLGVGAYQTDAMIQAYSGIQNVAHNSYLEFFLIGGIPGIIALVYYGLILRSGLRVKNPRFNLERKSLRLLVYAFLLTAFFLSLSYNSIIWMLAVYAISLRINSEIETSQ